MTTPHKKIAFFIDAMHIGGTERQLVKLIERLALSKFMVYLVTIRPSNNEMIENLPCEKLYCPVTSFRSMQFIRQLFRIIQFVRANDIDIVCSYFIDSFIVGTLAGKLAGVRCILTSRRDLGFWHTPRLLKIVRFFSKWNHGYIVNSDAIRQVVIQKEYVASDRVTVIPNAIPDAIFSAKHTAVDKQKTSEAFGLSTRKHKIGIVSNLNRRVKRVDIFIKVAALVHKKNKNIEWVVVGDGNLRTELEGLAENLGIQDNVHFLGQLDNVLDILKIFDVVLNTSETEGRSNSVLEAMALGIPVIASDNMGNREIVIDGYNGFVAPINNLEAFGEKILQLCDDSELHSKLSNSAIQFTEKFTEKHMEKAYVRYFQDMQ